MTDVQWHTDGDVQFAIVGRHIAVVEKWRSLFGEPDNPEQWEASHYLIRCQRDTNLLEIIQDGGAICASEAEAKETALDVAGYYYTTSTPALNTVTGTGETRIKDG